MTLLEFAASWLGLSCVTAALWSLWRRRPEELPPPTRCVAPGANHGPWRAS
jgi:hypothetical protein